MRTATRRRTQAERRAESRDRLLDAALGCLAERGYAGTTFPEVVRRAGLSNGALWRHFRTKAELMVAASLHAEEQLGREAIGDGPSPDGDVAGAVARLWTWVHQPAFQALVELLRASRGDAELAEALTDADARAADLFFSAVGAMLGPDLADRPEFRRNVRMLGLILYGTGITAGLRRPADDRLLLGEVQEAMQVLFGDGKAPASGRGAADGR